MLGTEAPAEQGTLVMFASAILPCASRCSRVLDAMGANRMSVGAEVGLGRSSNWFATRGSAPWPRGMRPVVRPAKGLGLDQQLMLDALDELRRARRTCKSRVRRSSSRHTPRVQRRRGPQGHGLIRDAVVASGLSTALIDGVRAAFDAAAEAGHGDDDMAAVYFDW